MEELTDFETRALNTKENSSQFKKPILVGKIGQLPKKIEICSASSKKDSDVCLDVPIQEPETLLTLTSVVSSCASADKNSAPPYKEPTWSSLPQSIGKPYVLEVLKSGSIVEEINLMNKPYWVFGRSPTCDLPLMHPTISRYHAVLQYRGVGSEKDPAGFYIYDLASTHGSFLNKGHLKSLMYVPVRVGHIIKFGFSSRSFLLTGPEGDAEAESEFTITQLKQQRTEKLLQRELSEQEALRKEQCEIEEKRKKEEERGVDWGLGEDAEEEPDLTENPYAQSNNEELYIEDPKKALRGFMEREGFTLDYDCTEHGFGQFLCKVELPVDDEHGRPVIAEVLHKGKKKEAVVQCALEACRILDRHGLLRQATHESRKRKAKNWEENDYYDSDDDTFLDRTGAIEKKREKRMNTKLPQQPENYQSLLEKEQKISAEILKIEKELSITKFKNDDGNKQSNNEDTLESYMKDLKESKLSKQSISRLKSTLVRLKTDLITVTKLANLAKPTDLPQLVTDKPLTIVPASKKNLPLFGKRLKAKLHLPLKPVEHIKQAAGEEEDGDEEEDISNKINKVSPQLQEHVEAQEKQTIIPVQPRKSSFDTHSDDESDEDLRDDKELTPEELKKRQKRNQRRIKQRRGKAEMQKQKGYEEDAQKEDYNMWIPPTNQTGDGRTNLNEKFGY